MKFFFWILLGVIITVVVTLGISLGLKSTIGIWNANIDRKIFEQNKTYIHGTIQALTDLKLQYETSESDLHKKGIREAMLREYSAFPHKSKLPTSLNSFISNL